jgi:outer membrane protein assembly factor BamB
VTAGGTSTGSPMVTDEWILVQSEAGMNRIEPGKCGPGLLDQGTPRDQAPAVSDGIVYSVLGTTIFTYEPGTLTGAVVNAAGDDTVGYWSTPFDAGSAITGPPAIAGGVVFVGTQDGLVFGVDASTGEELWRFNAGSSILGSPAPVNGGVLVLTADGEVILITNGG